MSRAKFRTRVPFGATRATIIEMVRGHNERSRGVDAGYAVSV